MAALLAHKGSSVYSGTKAALEIMTDVMRLELMPWDVSVSIVEPAYVKTSIASKQIGANAAWRHADKAKLPLYQDWLDTQEAKRATSDRMAATTEVTNDAIVHALTAEYPKTRYVVANVKGIPAWILTRISWLLPDRIKDLAAVRF